MGRRSIWPPELLDFMREFVPGHTKQETQAAVLEQLGIEMTIEQITAAMKNYHIRSGLPGGHRPGESKLFPRDVVDYIMTHYEGVGPKRMAEILTEKFGVIYTHKQLHSFYQNHHIRSGLTGQFEKGCVPYTKGKTWDEFMSLEGQANSRAAQFKKGHTPMNKLPVGSVVVKCDGYLWKKISDDSRDWRENWKQLHIIYWEKLHGPVPEGMRVTFKDGDKMNVSPENLALVTLAENAQMTTRGLRSPEFAKDDVGVNLAKAYDAIHKAKKGKQHEVHD